MARQSTTTTSDAVRCEVERPSELRFVVVLYLNPVPASRPRVSRWGTYYGKTYSRWKKLAEAAVPKSSEALAGPLIVDCDCVLERPKTSKRIYPKGDVDNFIKGILDVLTKRGYWQDDDQIVELLVRKRFVDENERPHTRIHARQA